MSDNRFERGIELAPLPRERVGPFLILGAAKDASPDAVEAHRARAVLWARQGKTQIALGDIHWARDTLRDLDRRLQADVGSLNCETAAGELRRLAQHYHLDSGKPAWQPFDPDPPAPTIANVPDPAAECGKLPAPEVPIELPGVARWLEAFAQAPLDPWAIDLMPPAKFRDDDNE